MNVYLAMNFIQKKLDEKLKKKYKNTLRFLIMTSINLF